MTMRTGGYDSVTKRDLLDLKIYAAQCRLNVLRMLKASGHGHIGGAFSALDIVTALYFYKMQVRPQDPLWEDRDRFLLSAGHKALAQYSVLAERGFFSKELLDTYGSLDCKLPGHPDMHKLPGIEANTGALGHGLSIATGMALSLRLQQKSSQVYVILGDGELAEGSNWEAIAAAAHYHLSNLTVFIDFNGLQISGRVQTIMDLTPISERFSAFGWSVADIDGNSMEEVVRVLDRLPLTADRPTAIIAHTVKAKGLSFGEDDVAYHFWNADEGHLAQAKEELTALIEQYRAEQEALS